MYIIIIIITVIIIIIIMYYIYIYIYICIYIYIYHVLISALSTHIKHINQYIDMIFDTHVEHGLTKTIYIKFYVMCKLRKLPVCLLILCNFCIFGNCSLSFKIQKYVILYCDVVNVQPCFNFFDEIIK